MGLNLGTGTPEAAAALVEYCNLDQGTEWSDLRRKHGVAQPYKVKRWCLGNEMDGPWQIGHMTATEYGMKAQDAARQMRYVDPSLQLIACGSSGPFMPTYLEWDREVLEQCYDYVDGLSLHRYLTNSNGLLRQTIYYPYSWALQYAHGSVLNVLVESPAYEVAKMGQIPYVDVAGTLSAQDGKIAIFVLNRDLSKPHVVQINWQDKAPGQVLA